MIPYMRRKLILELLHTKELVYIEEIVEKVGVSLATVRRDLNSLADEGHIELLSGGAAKIKQVQAEKSLVEKLELNKDEKELISGYAATLVNDGEFIYIGPGTTENWMIKYLSNKQITVVTNGAYHLEELRRNNITTILLGGEVKHTIAVITGPSTNKQIKDMVFDKVFIGCSGYSTRGASTSDQGVAECNRIAIENAKEVYIIADSTKMDRDSRYVFVTPDEKYEVITTERAQAIKGQESKFIFVNE